MLPVYWLSFLFPRNKKIWLFGSTFGRRFTDNPRYLYLHVHQLRTEGVRPIWISHKREVAEFLMDNGYEAYYHHSLKGVLYCLRGKAYIFDNYSKDISFWLSGGAVKINLWHGVAFKKINHDNLHDRARHPRSWWERFRYALRTMTDEKPSHYVLATSEKMAEIYAGAFKVPREHVIVGGYPRNDALLGDKDCFALVTEKERSVKERLLESKRGGRKVILYMPTFRESETRFFEVMDLPVFASYLRENELVFVTKLHPKSQLNQEFMMMGDEYAEEMVYVDSEVDVYAILGEADVLVTDYSSVYADFLLLNRPSVLFPYDYGEYMGEIREGYFTYEEFMKDEKAYTMEELMEKINSVLSNDVHGDDRKGAVSWMFGDGRGNACEELVEAIVKLLRQSAR